MSGMKVWSLVVFSNHSAFHWWPRVRHFSCCQMNWWVVTQLQMVVSIFDAMHSHLVDRWKLSETDIQAPWHSVLETVWLHCDKAQRLDACENWKVVRWCRTQASGHNLQDVVDGRVSEAGMSTAAPWQERSTLRLNGPGLRWLFSTLLLQHPSQS